MLAHRAAVEQECIRLNMLRTQTEKRNANSRSYANVYKRRGKLRRQPCEKCASENSEMHHEDYNKPLQINWLCRKCHLELHKLFHRNIVR